MLQFWNFRSSYYFLNYIKRGVPVITQQKNSIFISEAIDLLDFSFVIFIP